MILDHVLCVSPVEGCARKSREGIVSRFVLCIQVRGQRDTLFLVRLFEFIICLCMIVNHVLSEFLDDITRPSFYRNLPEFHFGHSSRRRLFRKLLVRNYSSTRTIGRRLMRKNSPAA